MKKLSGLPILVLFVTVLLTACGGGGGGGGGHGGQVQAPSPPPVSSGTLSTAEYSGTQSPGDLWNLTLTSSSSSPTLAGVDSTSTLSLGTLTVTDQANGYYALSSNNYSAFALVQSNFLWVLPVSGGTTTPSLVFNPIFAARSAPCVTTNGTRTYVAGNFTNTTSMNNNQFYFMPPIDFTILGGSATITSVTFNKITINITGLTCSGGVWTGNNGLTVIASGDLLVGDLGTNTTTGFPSGTTGFIAMVPLSKPSLTTLNQAHFVLADVTPATANTANPGAGRFIKAGELGGTNTVDNNLYVYAYGGCQAASAAQTYPTSGNTLSAVGTYVWSLDPQSGAAFIQYMVPSSCGFGGTYLMYMGQLANGKLIGLPSYNAAGGDLGAPILIQE